MRSRRLVSALTLMAFVGCLFAMPGSVAAQGYFNNGANGSDQGFNVWNRSFGNNASHGGFGTILKKVLPGVIGGVAGYFLGASLGPIGRIAAAAVGFFVAKFIADKLFPGNRYSYNSYVNDSQWGYRNQQNNSWGNGGQGWHPSETGGATGNNTNLQALRDRWVNATTAYQNSLSSGNSSNQSSARAEFEAARAAYFGAIGSNYSNANQ